MIVHPEANELVVHAATNERILGLKRALRENTISSWVAREGRSFSYSDAPGYPAGFLPHDKTLSRYQTGTFLSVPVLNEKRMVGVFNVTDPVSGKITPSTEKTVSHLTRWIGAMIPPTHRDGVKRADE
jgi:signal transduction protein with GAF and PtsI domain